MISFEDALDAILDSVAPLETVSVPLIGSLNMALSETIYSPINMPPFDQSAMDGYAICEGDFESYTVVGEIQAGADASAITLSPGEAVRIFTGAMVPKSASTVVKQEITLREGNILQFTEAFSTNANIRREAEQIEKGSIALDSGTVMNPAAIGFLGMLGIIDVPVYRKPVVKIIVTGNELVSPGQSLNPGQIYESNSTTLMSALNKLGISVEVVRIKDTYQETFSAIEQLLQTCDVLLTSGGISVGDYDFVGKAMLENGVRERFYKVKQKPGKPLFYGTMGKCSVFALPGNPASALTGMYLYVYPAVQKLMGYSTPGLVKRSLPIEDSYRKTPVMTHFLKGYWNGLSVKILDNQSSAMLNSFAEANCLIQLEEGREQWSPGDLVSVFLL